MRDSENGDVRRRSTILTFGILRFRNAFFYPVVCADDRLTRMVLPPLTELPDFLAMNPDGEIRLKGHRIRLIDIASRYDEGCSPEGILLDFYPTLSLPLIHKTIAFYLEHQDDVRTMLEQNARESQRLIDAAPSHPTLIELRARLASQSRAH